ncbi:hypothetical protein BS47DRAFT_1398125 [Hydnum rufescens UP504]|uniref:Uncharacterized protein n=1 Tax=Hydnum rufescens UP504 TaxID=1448309 RepID=A0A9P6ALI0_9AGAM|nr:hypothetical protein BS47DRAFT_1398125 [Hydnum rufescens UP504]
MEGPFTGANQIAEIRADEGGVTIEFNTYASKKPTDNQHLWSHVMRIWQLAAIIPEEREEGQPWNCSFILIWKTGSDLDPPSPHDYVRERLNSACIPFTSEHVSISADSGDERGQEREHTACCQALQIAFSALVVRTDSWKKLWQAFFEPKDDLQRVRILQLADDTRLPDDTAIVVDRYNAILVTAGQAYESEGSGGPEKPNNPQSNSVATGSSRSQKRRSDMSGGPVQKKKRVHGGRKKGTRDVISSEFIVESDEEPEEQGHLRDIADFLDGVVPPWLADPSVKEGIQISQEVASCQQELERCKGEHANLRTWFHEEYSAAMDLFMGSKDEEVSYFGLLWAHQLYDWMTAWKKDIVQVPIAPGAPSWDSVRMPLALHQHYDHNSQSRRNLDDFDASSDDDLEGGELEEFFELEEAGLIATVDQAIVELYLDSE